jgi:hypothetical protein
MDMSKLPRLSKTETPAPSGDRDVETPPTGIAPVEYGRPERYYRVPNGRGPEAWISVGVGLILLFAFPHFTQWWGHAVFHTRTPSFLPITSSEDGSVIPYPKSDFFLNDLAIASFAYALILEGIALLLAGRNRPGIVLFALLITIVAVGLNAWYLVSSFGDGIALVSAFAIVFGGYMIWFEWNLAGDLLAIRRGNQTSTPRG